MTLRAYLVTLGVPAASQPRDHRALRWVSADELGRPGAWVPADRGWLPDLRAALRA